MLISVRFIWRLNDRDRQIIERGNLTTKVDPGDSVMTDKGFDVQDIFATVDVTINIPTLILKMNRMSGKTVLKDRKITPQLASGHGCHWLIESPTTFSICVIRLSEIFVNLVFKYIHAANISR